jgi:hypothetical protein
MARSHEKTRFIKERIRKAIKLDPEVEREVLIWRFTSRHLVDRVLRETRQEASGGGIG